MASGTPDDVHRAQPDAYPVGEPPKRERRRIAVVGSGVAGLTAAHLLSRGHEVTIFEREAAVGMDAHSIDVHGARMDIPLRVFSESYYPNLCSLYKLLGVKYSAADYSFACLGAGPTASAYFRYINFFARGMALPVLFCLNPSQVFKCIRLGAQFAHFVNRSPALLDADRRANESSAEPNLGSFLRRHGYTLEFATQLLYPMLSVVCTCTYESVAAYPASIIIDYFANKYGLSGAQCRAYDGTRDVVVRLTSNVHRVVTSASVAAVHAPTSIGGTVGMTWVGSDGRSTHEEYDEVVLAMQANASLKVLNTCVAEQNAALSTFRYESKRVVLHTDGSLMPPHRRDWSPLNIVVSPNADAASVTVWMNHIDSSLRKQLQCPVYQTWNPLIEPAKGTVIADYSFERPVVTPKSQEGMAQLCRNQGKGHIWFVGAYSRYSMPLLENGVTSAMEVARGLGVDVSDVEVDIDALGEAASATSAKHRMLGYVLVLGAAILLITRK